jgi:hypothetical protein
MISSTKQQQMEWERGKQLSTAVLLVPVNVVAFCRNLFYREILCLDQTHANMK